MAKIPYQFKPLTLSAWQDFQELFGERGACGGCWCMVWRLPRGTFERQKGEGNRKAMHALLKSGTVPGILAYHSNKAVGWCALAPRETYPALSRSRILKPVDAQAVWSVSCFFIHKNYRKQGLSVELLKAAQDYARSQGGKILEGYPVEPKQSPMPAAFAWTGLAHAFQKAGFTECARRSETRPIMRIDLGKR